MRTLQTIKWHIAVIALALTGANTGCGGGGGTISQIEPLEISVETDKVSYHSGETVNITYKIANPSNGTVDVRGTALLTTPDGTALYDVPFEVLHGSSLILSYTVVPQVGGSVSIAPHSTVPVRMTWDQKDEHGIKMPPGVYTIRAFAYLSFVNSTSVTSPDQATRTVLIRID